MRNKQIISCLFSFFISAISHAYIGYQSFTLDDDLDYRSLKQAIEIANQRVRDSERELGEAQFVNQQLLTRESQLHEVISNNPLRIQQLEQIILQINQEISQTQTEIPQMQIALTEAQNQLLEANNQIASSQSQLITAKQDLEQTKISCTPPGSEDCNIQIDEKQTVVANLQGALVGLRGQKGIMQTQVQQLQLGIQNSTAKVKTDQVKVENTQAEIINVTNETETAQNELIQLEQHIQETEDRILQTQGQLQLDQSGYQNVSIEFQRYRDELIYNIDLFNNNGAIRGDSDGRKDGTDQARYQGENHGHQDGSEDGNYDGTKNGKYRDYTNGERKGEEDGTAQAKLNGTSDGKSQGIQKALQDLGTKEGIANGIDRASKSDAQVVGTNQGIASGLDRSLKDGQVQGRKLGQEEAIKQSESGELKKINIEGPYARTFQGTFAKRSPSMPPGFRGPSFSPSTFYGKDIYRSAFTDGYIYSYDQNVSIEFNRTIDFVYNSSYDRAYKLSYDSAFSQTYTESYNGGYKDGFNAVYNRVYNETKNRQFQISYDLTMKDPDRNNSEYTTAFQKNSTEAYNKKYEEIRLQAFQQADADTYSKNIKLRIAEFKAQRLVEVKDIYANHAVMGFESSKITDAGVRKITPHDGYFQPGETILHTVVVKNFGARSLIGGKIRALTGEESELPEIPARSIVTVRGAIVSSIAVNARTDIKHQAVLQVIAPLTSQDLVQAVHFDNPDKAILKREVKDVAISYPIFFSGVRNDFAYKGLKFGQVQQLRLSLMNMSDVIYNNLNVEVSSNANNDILVTKFAAIPEVNSGLELADGKIIISDRRDMDRTIEIRALLKFKGVVLGVLNAPITFKVLR
jgi:hypothetical protein